MNGIALVFFTLNIYTGVYTGPTFSDKLFSTHQECADFLVSLTNNQVVDKNFEFQFASYDGLVFKGGCYTAEEYNKKYK